MTDKLTPERLHKYAIDYMASGLGNVEAAKRCMKLEADLEAKQAPVDKEGWLTRGEIQRWIDDCERIDPKGSVEMKALCRMALAALNGPPAVDLGKVREALAEIDEANDLGGMCYSDKLHSAVQKLRAALPPAPTDHKEK